MGFGLDPAGEDLRIQGPVDHADAGGAGLQPGQWGFMEDEGADRLRPDIVGPEELDIATSTPPPARVLGPEGNQVV